MIPDLSKTPAYARYKAVLGLLKNLAESENYSDSIALSSIFQKFFPPLRHQKIEKNPLKTQVGGSHYMDCIIQPIEYIEANNLAFLEGCIIKRITRHDKPTGKGRQDIEKIIHECEILLKLRYGDDNAS